MFLLLLACTSPLAPGSDDSRAATDDTQSTDDTAGPTQQQQNLRSGAGDFALDYLQDSTYDSLLIEIDYVSGAAPDPDAVAALEAALADLCDKSQITTRLDDELPPQGAPAWTVQQATDLEVEWRDSYRDPESGQAVLYFLYLDGHSDLDSDAGRILGYAVRGSSMVMFKDTIDSTGSGLPLAAGVEETVIVHELGHVLGLVNNGVDMVEPHQDTDHGKHDDDEGCIMYWAVETDAVVDLLLSGAPDFDASCRADLQAAKQGR